MLSSKCHEACDESRVLLQRGDVRFDFGATVAWTGDH